MAKSIQFRRVLKRLSFLISVDILSKKAEDYIETFTEAQVENYMKWTSKSVLSVEKIAGRCHICGELLNDIELPKGPEKKVVCLKDRDYFIEGYNGIIDFGGFE